MPSDHKIGRLGVIGHPIAQSLSPVMQQTWLDDAAIDIRYEKWDIAPDALDAFVEQARRDQYVGFNVTIPHKEAIIPFLDRIAPAAQAIGAVNTVVRHADGALVGYNTDGLGFLAHLKRAAPGWRQDFPVVMIGAGGAARAILTALLTTSVPLIMIANRSRERADQLAGDVGRGRARAIPMDDIPHALMASGLLINSTSLGMNRADVGTVSAANPLLDLDLSHAPADLVVNDIVYKPLETDLLRSARARGLETVDGLGMLIGQGAAAFRLWFGAEHNPNTGEDLRLKLLDHL